MSRSTDLPLAERSSPSGKRAATRGPKPVGVIRRLLRRRESAVTIGLVGLCLTFAIVNGTTFASFANVRNITLDTTTILILAVGATFVLISGGLDLSIGSVLVFSQVIAAKVMIALGGDGWLVLGAGVVVGLISGMAWGLLNGGLVAYGRLNSIIVTLATLGGALGLTQLITSGTDVSEVPPQAAVIGLGRLFGLPYLVVFAFAVTAVFGLLLATTRFGRHTYAIGSNEQAARNAGINVATHYLCVYALSGALSGFAGVLSLFRFSVTSIGGHALDNVAALTAVILGGVSIFGGVGSMFGTFIGAFIPSVLDNGLVISRVSSYWQPVVVAAVLIAAVYLDRIRQDHSDQ